MLAGFPVVDFKATLIDGAYHDVDSSALAFEIAARAAFREGMKKAGPIILEPIMEVEVVTPEDHIGDVVGDSCPAAGKSRARTCAPTRRRQCDGAAVQHVRLCRPVRSGTQGRANFTMQFDHYERCRRASRPRSSRNSSEAA